MEGDRSCHSNAYQDHLHLCQLFSQHKSWEPLRWFWAKKEGSRRPTDGQAAYRSVNKTYVYLCLLGDLCPTSHMKYMLYQLNSHIQVRPPYLWGFPCMEKQLHDFNPFSLLRGPELCAVSQASVWPREGKKEPLMVSRELRWSQSGSIQVRGTHAESHLQTIILQIQHAPPVLVRDIIDPLI